MRCTVRMGSEGMKKRQQEHTSRVGNAVAIVSGAVLWWFCRRRIVVMRCGEDGGRPICCTNSACESNRHMVVMVRDRRRRQKKLNINQQGHVHRSLNELEQNWSICVNTVLFHSIRQ